MLLTEAAEKKSACERQAVSDMRDIQREGERERYREREIEKWLERGREREAEKREPHS